jgi:hypothetical protein
MLLKMLSIPTVVDFYAKLQFFFQSTNYAPSSSCCLRRGDEQLRLGAVNGDICRRRARQRSATGLLGQSGHQGLGGAGHHRRKADDRSYESR